MINKLLNIKHKNALIIVSFLILSILSILIMALSYKTTGLGDTHFHWQRIREIAYSIKHFTLPKLALNSFNYNGSAVMSMYPYFTLIPFAIASIFINSIIILFYFMFSFYIFIAMIIAFYSSKSITNNKLTSYVFAVIYGLIGNFELANTDFGVNIVIVVLPLAIFGMVSFIKNNKWIELSIGMSLILFSNLLAFTITLSTFIIFLIINYKRITLLRIKNLIKAIILSLFTTSIFLVPFIKLSLLNNLQIPKMFGSAHVLDKIQNSLNITQFVSSNIGMSMNYIATITIFGGLFFITKMNKITKQFYLMGTFIFIFSASSTIWNFIINSPLKFMTIIQFPTRIYFISQILLTFVFSILITKYIKYTNKEKLLKSIFVILSFVLLSQMSMQWLFYNQNIANSTDNVIDQRNENQYHHITFETTTDYYPNNSLPMLGNLQSNNAIYHNNKIIKTKPNGMGNFSLRIPNNNIKKINLPFLYYNGIHYQVYMDGKEMPFYSNKTSLITINNVQKGNHNIQISIKNSWDYIITYIMFIISILIYILLLFKYLKERFKY